MSWSFSGVGKPKAVLASARDTLPRYHCAEPEETIKDCVLKTIEVALSAFPDHSAVQVDVNGSQSGDGKGALLNSLNVSIKPIYGFVE